VTDAPVIPGGPYGADLELALTMADAADALTMRHFRSSDLLVTTKPDLTPVTEADHAAERLLRDVLRERRPHDAVLGEEFGTTGDGDRRWVLDPIDGTKNYVRGVPVWATLIALLDGPDVVLGVVSAPALARRWWAARHAGSWSTAPGQAAPRRLRVSQVPVLADASFSYSDEVGWAERGAAAGLAALRGDCWRSRAYGDFWSHLLVAEGAVDVAAEPQLGPWDIAALVPVVTEAGGRITGFDGSPAATAGCALTSNGLLHAEVLALVAPRG
jgi:histidinol-phosphatase